MLLAYYNVYIGTCVGILCIYLYLHTRHKLTFNFRQGKRNYYLQRFWSNINSNNNNKISILHKGYSLWRQLQAAPPAEQSNINKALTFIGKCTKAKLIKDDIMRKMNENGTK